VRGGIMGRRKRMGTNLNQRREENGRESRKNVEKRRTTEAPPHSSL